MNRNIQTTHGQTLEARWPDFDHGNIHLPGYVQPHGVLFVLEEPRLTVVQVSQNVSNFFDVTAEALLQQPIETLFPRPQMNQLKQLIHHQDFDVFNLVKFRLKRGESYDFWDGILHRNSDGFLILELEPGVSIREPLAFDFYHSMRTATVRLRQTATFADLCQSMIQEMQRLAGFDRVMVYRFDPDWSGVVIAETRPDDVEPYLGLHFPDIDTRPCRYLFTQIRSRLLVDIRAEPAQLVPEHHPVTRQPLDLKSATLRGISPCYKEYLENMGARANLVLPLLKEQTLWGMISCHHYTPRYISYEARQACEFLGQVMSMELLSKEKRQDYDNRMSLQALQADLAQAMSQSEIFLQGLVQSQTELLKLVGAGGVAISWTRQWTLMGNTPPEAALNPLVDWLRRHMSGDSFHSYRLSAQYPAAEQFKETGSGLLALSISPHSYILWFRPEVAQTVNWAGYPHVPMAEAESAVDRQPDREETPPDISPETPNLPEPHGEERVARLRGPRPSFELWKETVQGQSLPWQPYEVEAACGLRDTIVNIVLHQAEELSKLAQELKRSNAELERFAYVASHDLQEPLNLVSSYVQLLEMRYQDQLDQDAKDFIGFATEGVRHMQTLIDDLLAYSRVGSRGQTLTLTDIEGIVQQVRTHLHARIEEAGAVITQDALPQVMADERQLDQLFQNLIGNAIKFKSDRPPAIHIGVQLQDDRWLFSVQDNGIGVDPKFRDRIFLIFQRLHTRDEYPGTGIGLAICKKIVECHGGHIWIESQPNQGATFYFTLPR